MKVLLTVPLLLLLPAFGWADPPAWVGYWAESPEWCSRAGDVGEKTPDAYLKDGIFGLEWSCDFDEITPIGIGQSWAVKTTCLDAGYEYTQENIYLITLSDRLLIIGAEGETFDLVRCSKIPE